jgi:hypothetical protein
VDKLFNDYRSAVTGLPAATERAELASPQERDGALLSANWPPFWQRFVSHALVARS